MSISVNPSSTIGFHRPLTSTGRCTLSITNNNSQPVAFKVKTTAAKSYTVRPNQGRIEPGKCIDVSVMRESMLEEPPISAKCKDKFLIQSALIAPEEDHLHPHEFWDSKPLVVHQHKLRVGWLSAEGPTIGTTSTTSTLCEPSVPDLRVEEFEIKELVSLNPGTTLEFGGPLTNPIKRSLTITNNNCEPVEFKVKTTAPKLYTVYPNSGRIEPGRSFDISVMHQPMPKEPPMSAKCKDKFLILSTQDQENLTPQEFRNVSDSDEDKEPVVDQLKLEVVWIPPVADTSKANCCCVM